MPFIARESFHAALDNGAEVSIEKGQEVDDDHPVVAGREHLFAETVAVVDGDAPKRGRTVKA